MRARLRRSAVLLTGALIPASLLIGHPAAATAAADPVSGAFAEAAATYEVPRDLLVSLAYAETHLDGTPASPAPAAATA